MTSKRPRANDDESDGPWSDDVTAELMHDVNGALAVISASAEYVAMLRPSERKGPNYEEALDDILAGVQRATRVSRRLMSLARGADVERPIVTSTEASPWPETERPRLAQCRVLLVEDDASVRRGVARLLGREGALVEMATTGRQAVARLVSPPVVDLVVLDSDLPDGDGPWVLRTLSKVGWEAVPVLGMSGHESGAKLREAGAASFLAKPFSRVEFVATCERLVRGRA